MNKDSGIIQIGVISDVHAHLPSRYAGKPAPSRLPVRSGSPNPLEDPFAGLKKLIEKEGLTVEILLCPGDMTCQADPDGLTYAWARLHEVGAAFGASITAATVGNHDLASRDVDDAMREEARDHMLRLYPHFPLSDKTLSDRFWARNYVLFRHREVLIALVNSCPLHTVANSKEFERGTVTLETLRALNEELSSTPPAETNILMCHHHPQSHAELQLGEMDVMKHGQLMLDGLENHGDWIVIHGHKHHPKITYAAGGGRSPVVFGAGSFGGEFGPAAGSVCKNQFYIVETPRKRGTPGARGTVRAWNWAYGIGWVPSSDATGVIPSFCGFGGRRHPERLAKEIASKVGSAGAVEWSALCANISDLAFLIPRDYSLLKQVLASRHKLRVIEEGGSPAEVGRSHAKS